jgi:hypothetical protein
MTGYASDFRLVEFSEHVGMLPNEQKPSVPFGIRV